MMTNKLTINLDTTKVGYTMYSKKPYLYTIVDEGGFDMYEIQIHKLNFPSSRKDIRSGKAVGSDVVQIPEYSGHKIEEAAKKHYGEINK